MKPQHFIVALALLTGYWVLELYAPFLQNILIGALLAIATSEIQLNISKRIRNKITASLVSTSVLFVLFFAPITYFALNFASYVQNFNVADVRLLVDELQHWIGFVGEFHPQLESEIAKLSTHLKSADFIQGVLGYGASFGIKGAVFFKDLLLILVFYFFSVLYGERILRFLSSLIPLREDDLEELFLEVSSVMGVVFYSIVAVAILEGFLFGLITAVFGYDGIFLGILYGFSSLIPVIGGIILWIPVALYEAANGSTMNAIIILVYSVLVISTIADTFIKPMIIAAINKKMVKTSSHINELLIFFSILAGLATYGFWGMILGPAITALFISVLRLYGNLMMIHSSQTKESEN